MPKARKQCFFKCLFLYQLTFMTFFMTDGYDSYVGAPWTNAPMCEMDSDTGLSNLHPDGPNFCFLTQNDTVVEMPLRIEK